MASSQGEAISTGARLSPACSRGSVAQLVERSTENRKVTGSTPVGATIESPGIPGLFAFPAVGRVPALNMPRSGCSQGSSFTIPAMSLSRLRRALETRGRTLQALLLSLGSVVAVVVGLLSIHAMSTEVGHSGIRAQVSAVHVHTDAVEDSHAHVATVTDPALCGLDCGGGYPLLFVACVLALLVSALTLFGPALLARLRMSLKASPAPLQRGSRPEAPAPSLTLLSISRI